MAESARAARVFSATEFFQRPERSHSGGAWPIHSIVPNPVLGELSLADVATVPQPAGAVQTPFGSWPGRSLVAAVPVARPQRNQSRGGAPRWI